MIKKYCSVSEQSGPQASWVNPFYPNPENKKMADEKPKQSHDESNSSENKNGSENSWPEPVVVQSKTDINSSARSLRYQSKCNNWMKGHEVSGHTAKRHTHLLFKKIVYVHKWELICFIEEIKKNEYYFNWIMTVVLLQMRCKSKFDTRGGVDPNARTCIHGISYIGVLLQSCIKLGHPWSNRLI